MNSEHSNKTILALAIVSAFLFVALLLSIYYFQFVRPSITPPVAIPTITPAPTSSWENPAPTSSWETYESQKYKLSFSHPADYIIEESGNQIIINKSKDNSFSIKVRDDYTPAETSTLLDSPTTGSRKIGDLVWNVYDLPEGYQDGGYQGTSPIYALSLENTGKLVQIVFYNHTNTTSLEDQILSTFRLL